MESNLIALPTNWSMIESLLPKNWRCLAERFKLLRRSYPPHMDTKVTDIAQALRLMLHMVATNSSFMSTVATGAAAQIVTMSPVALHKWMQKSGPFVAAVAAEMAGSEQLFAASRWAGYDIVIVDGSSVSRPGAEGTTARIHYALRLSTLRLVQFEVTDDKGGETFRRFMARPGELWMGDRGYANPPGVASIVAKGADVLVRWNRGSLPFYDVRGESLDVRRLLGRLGKPCKPREWFAAVHPADGGCIRGRICAVRLPPEKAEEARTRLRREQGSAVTKASLDMAEYVVIFTTVPKDRLSVERVLELYGLRWQVELHIKRDKSIAGLDRLPNFREDTIYTWICLKLLLTQIARNMATSTVAIPP